MGRDGVRGIALLRGPGGAGDGVGEGRARFRADR